MKVVNTSYRERVSAEEIRPHQVFLFSGDPHIRPMRGEHLPDPLGQIWVVNLASHRLHTIFSDAYVYPVTAEIHYSE